MLHLSRRAGEVIVIPAARLEVVVEEIAGDRVQLGFRAPTDVEIYRQEIWQDICFQRYEEDEDGDFED